MKKLLLTLFVLAQLSSVAQVRYVTVSGAGNGSGTGWSNAISATAFRPILEGAASGTQFWIATGTYKPAINSRDSGFRVPSGVKIFGGFAGTETALTQRDSTNTTRITTLSGEVQNDNNIYNNTFNVVWLLNSNTNTELNSLTITQGCADGSFTSYVNSITQSSGAGIVSWNSNALIANVKFTGSVVTGGGGGGISAANGNLRLVNCWFEGNKASGGGGAYFSKDVDAPGGYLPMSISFDRCTFKKNSSSFAGGGASIGGKAFFTNCTFDGDSATDYGGGLMGDNADTLTIRNCVFKNNYNDYGVGGGLCTDGVCYVENTMFENNRARNGGAICNTGLRGIFTNSTFAKNGACCGQYADGATAYFEFGGTAQFSNCVFDSVTSGLSQFTKDSHSAGPFTITNSIGMKTFPSWIVNGGNNLQGRDPLFVNYAAGDYSLKICSPAINSGQNSLMIPSASANDLANNPRRYANGVVDMGAYEFQGPNGTTMANYTSSSSLKAISVTYNGTSTAPLDSLVWSWGDGQKQKVATGFTTSLSHTYATSGRYNVCVTAYSICGSNQYCTQTALGVNTLAALGNVKVYPNPASDFIIIEGMAGGKAVLLSLMGQVVSDTTITSEQQAISLSGLSPTTYLLMLTNANGASGAIRVVRQ